MINPASVHTPIDQAKKRLYELLLQEGGVRVSDQGVIRPRRTDHSLPLSFAQQRLWLLDQIDPGQVAYNMSSGLRLRGELDVNALEASLSEIVRRHEILRTSFSAIGGEPRQVIAAPGAWRLQLLNLDHEAVEKREEEARRLVSEIAHRPFDLRHDSMFRAVLIKLDEEDQVLVLGMHHIVSDGWSIGVLFRELSTIYNAFKRNEESPLLELPIQYADYALWQREELQRAVPERQLSYWKQTLKGAPVMLELPVDHARTIVQSRRGAVETIKLSAELTEKINSLRRAEGATLFMTLLVAFQMLLARYSGQTDISVGTPIAGRNKREIEGLIGFFVNTVVMRTDLSGQPSFREALRRAKKVALGAYANQDVPFQKLVEELQPERVQNHQPLFQVFFSLLSEEGSAISMMDGLRVENVGYKTEKTQFDLMLTVGHLAGGLGASFCYNADLFESETIRRMLDHLRQLLRAAVDHPDVPFTRLPLLTGAERKLMLEQWNDSATHVEAQCIHRFFEQQVEETPEAIALVCGQQRLTYRELNERSNQVAHYLISLGIGPESLVGILLNRSTDLLVALLGVMKAGAAYLPLDPNYPAERIALILESAIAPVLLTTEALLEELPMFWGHTFCFDSQWDDVKELSTSNPQTCVSPENLAYAIFTSGSTGRPKGVLIEHRSVVNYLSWAARSYPRADGCGAPVHSSFSFDLTVTSLLMPLLRGELVHMLPDEAAAVTALADGLAANDYSLLKLTPAHLQVLSKTRLASASVGALVIGGEQLQAETVRFWHEQWPKTRMFNEYGPTETTVGCTFHELDHDSGLTGSVPVGRPIANTQIYILDAEQQPVPIGVCGEIFVGGAGVGRGYLGQPDITAERFVPDVFGREPGARLYRTGDIAKYKADGVIEYVGRIDEQIKLRGYRIELGEIEASIKQHESVKECAVVLREDRLVAYVAADSGVGANELRQYLKNRLPDYELPSIFVMLDEIPLTNNGKVDRRGLPDPQQLQSDLEESYVAPRNAIEETLCAIWIEVLEKDRVGIHDNFFDIGGHSLLATQLLTRVQDLFGIEFPLRTFFEAPTVTEFEQILVQELQQMDDVDHILDELQTTA